MAIAAATTADFLITGPVLFILDMGLWLLGLIGLLVIMRWLRAAEHQRQTLESTQREQESFFRHLAELIPFPIFYRDIAGHFQNCNSAFTRILGRTRAEILGHSVFDFAPRELADLCHAKDLELLAVGGRQEYQAAVLYADGTAHQVLFSKAIFTKSDGTPDGILGVMLDLTERLRVEEAAREQHTHLEMTLQAADMGVWSLDLITQRRTFDRQTCAHLGLDSATFQGSAEEFFQVVHGDDREMLKAQLIKTLAMDQLYSPEFRVVRADGSERVVTSRGRVVRDAAGQALRIDGILWDISERRQSEDALRESQEKAEAANRSKSEFLATMSHEIRTPLNGVIGLTGLLLRSGLNPDQTQMAELVKVSGQSLLTVINDILDLSKIEAGHVEIETVNFHLPRLTEDICGMFTVTAKAKGLALVVNVDPTLPTHLMGDPGRLRQILVNLVGNAVKFTDQGAVTLAITQEKSSPDIVRVLFSVSDTGPGIPYAYLPRLFSPFSQADPSSTRRHGGTGLGLTIVKRLIELMGGTVTVENLPGVGCRFSVSVTLRPSDQHANHATPIAAVAAVVPRPCQSLVLLVEDNLMNQTVTAMMLREMGYRCQMVSSGDVAIAMMATTTFDLVLMDCQMPGRDGFSTCQEIRLRGHHLPIIAITGNVFANDRERCNAVGMNDFLAKPYTYEELEKLLKYWLSRDREKSAETPR